ncbi:hypothetical protein LMP48_14355, partial [Staphylococcus aureus]|nr:hypothetical protein [Staphylococcus aureus]
VINLPKMRNVHTNWRFVMVHDGQCTPNGLADPLRLVSEHPSTDEGQKHIVFVCLAWGRKAARFDCLCGYPQDIRHT